MSHDLSMARLGANPYEIDVRHITTDDLKSALAAGFDDFKANPTHLVFLGIIYPVMGLILARFTTEAALLPLLFPLVAGFALVGPFAAVGLYELSRRREKGQPAEWKHAFAAFKSPAIGSIVTLGFGLMVILVVWLATARLIYRMTIGHATPDTMISMLSEIFATPQGWALIIVGNAVGFLFAAVAYAISAVSFPLLLDRNVGVGAAVQTSVRAITLNPRVMAIWGLIVVAGLVLGSIPFLIGLAIVMPVLGHATWHLYRRLVA